MGMGFQMGQILWDFISQCEIWHVCIEWGKTNKPNTITVLWWKVFKTGIILAQNFMQNVASKCSQNLWENSQFWWLSSNLHEIFFSLTDSCQRNFIGKKWTKSLEIIPGDFRVLFEDGKKKYSWCFNLSFGKGEQKVNLGLFKLPVQKLIKLDPYLTIR